MLGGLHLARERGEQGAKLIGLERLITLAGGLGLLTIERVLPLEATAPTRRLNDECHGHGVGIAGAVRELLADLVEEVGRDAPGDRRQGNVAARIDKRPHAQPMAVDRGLPASVALQRAVERLCGLGYGFGRGGFDWR